jgi:preprotein translocase SecE subunit
LKVQVPPGVLSRQEDQLMPSVKSEKPMATNALAAGDDEPEDQKPSRQMRTAVAPSQSGFFTIYKKGQGKWTRLGTVLAATLVGLLTAFSMYGYLQPYIHVGVNGSKTREVLFAISAGFLAVYALLIYWIMNKPSNADFLIATDSEMKKVNWTTKGELLGSTRVVIIFIAFIAIYLFLMDQIFQVFFWAINVLKIKPWFIH